MTKSIRILMMCWSVFILLSGTAKARDASTESLSSAEAPEWKKPAWLTELSVGVRESYDDNLLGVSGDGMPRQYSWVTTVSPKIRVDFLPMLGGSKTVKTFSMGYEPDVATYFQNSEESNTAHRIFNTLKGNTGPLSFLVDNAFLFVDGSSNAPTYPAPDNARSSYGNVFPRERRKQFQDRLKAELKWDGDAFFIRPAGTLLYYDLLTDQRAVSGYQNYSDRYDANAGLDIGRRIAGDLSLFLGYRYGHQYQQQIINAVYSATNDYQRVFAGMEGKPLKWLTLSLQVGPDFRSYADTAPVNDKNQVNFYGEAALTADMTERDAVTFRYKGNRWVSSTGQVPIFDSSYDLSYRHRFEKTFSWNLGARFNTSDYTCGNLTTGSAPSLRDDSLYVLSTGLTYALNAHVGVNFGVTANLGRNLQNGISNSDYRQFDEYLTSIGIFSRF